MLTPLLWHLLARSREAQRQREELLRRAVDAQELERRRIAGSLHDGPVQDLAATSFVLAGATARARAEGRDDLATELEGSAGAVRTSIRALRSLLVDLHPPSLARAGLESALGDLAQSVRAPGLVVEVAPVGEVPLDEEGQRLVHRVAQETLRNAAAHAAPCLVRVAVTLDGPDVVLDVVDDGPGFDVRRVLRDPAPGHLGVHLVADLAREAGAALAVRSRPGEGTHWQLRLPASYAGTGRS